MLESFQESLILQGDFNEFTASHLAIETAFGARVRVIQRWLVALHDIAHLLEQNPVFTLDLGVSLYKSVMLI